MTEQEIYKAAITKFGLKYQKDKLIEEMGELQAAVIRNRQNIISSNPKYMFNLYEKFIDVQIVMAQIELLLDPLKLAYYKGEKLKRLTNLIEE